MPEHKRIDFERDGVRKTWIWDDEKPELLHVKTEQDIEPILDSIERDRAMMKHDGINKLAARIPRIVYEKAVVEGWDEDDWTRWLNGEGAAFRIWRGRV